MVKIREASGDDKLDAIMQETTRRHGFSLDVLGWARKTYNVILPNRKTGKDELLARVESFAMTSGEVRVFNDKALTFAEDLGQQLETAFKLKEAVILREPTPE
jgi:hypothetical protein